MRTLNDYTNQLIALLPRGPAMPIVGVATWFKSLLEVFASELLQVETMIDDLKKELMPDTTNKLTGRWEQVLGLPDACTGELATLQERIAAILGKLSLLSITRGSLAQPFYIDLAAKHGYSITITVLSANNWRVNAAITTITYFRVGVSSVGDPLQSSSNDFLECVIRKYKPAHTNVTFDYT